MNDADDRVEVCQKKKGERQTRHGNGKCVLCSALLYSPCILAGSFSTCRQTNLGVSSLAYPANLGDAGSSPDAHLSFPRTATDKCAKV